MTSHVGWFALIAAAYVTVGIGLAARAAGGTSRWTRVAWVVHALVWPAVLLFASATYRRDVRPVLRRGPPREWWQHRYPADRETLDRLVARPDLGMSPSMAEPLLGAMQPGDELWTYTAPPKAWKRLAGRAGVALVREGKVVVDVVTILA